MILEVNVMIKKCFAKPCFFPDIFNILDVFFLYQEGMNFLKYNTFFSDKFIYLQKNKMF